MDKVELSKQVRKKGESLILSVLIASVVEIVGEEDVKDSRWLLVCTFSLLDLESLTINGRNKSGGNLLG